MSMGAAGGCALAATFVIDPVNETVRARQQVFDITSNEEHAARHVVTVTN